MVDRHLAGFVVEFSFRDNKKATQRTIGIISRSSWNQRTVMLSQLARRSARATVRANPQLLRSSGAAVASNSNSAALPQLASAAPTRAFASKSGNDDADDNSHSDFAPKYHAAPSTEKDEILKMIDSHVKTYPVMLYMKGTPSAPQCGFSMQVVRILHGQGVSFDSVNVLDHPEIRDGVKEYSYVQPAALVLTSERINCPNAMSSIVYT